MNFKKQARDKRNQIINEGDILQFDSDTLGVVTQIRRYGRDQIPDLRIAMIRADFLGRVTEVQRLLVPHTTFRNSFKLDEGVIREDVPKFEMAKKIREEALT